MLAVSLNLVCHGRRPAAIVVFTSWAQMGLSPRGSSISSTVAGGSGARMCSTNAVCQRS